MDDKDAMVISCTVVTDNHEHAVKAAEALARIAAGLVLDGINVSVSMFRGDAEEVEGGE